MPLRFLTNSGGEPSIRESTRLRLTDNGSGCDVTLRQVTSYTGTVNDAPDNLSPKSLKGDRKALLVVWSDGVEHRIPWQVLRDRCPCATCRQKQGEPAPVFNILKPEEAGPIRAIAMSPIGNYAYQIDFSDGHKTGIYSLEFLRELGSEQKAL